MSFGRGVTDDGGVMLVNGIFSQDEGENADDPEKASSKDIDPSNPREYIQKASASMDDEYSHKKGNMQNYYGIAHTLREPVEKQPTIVVNGRLKEYQVRYCQESPVC